MGGKLAFFSRLWYLIIILLMAGNLILLSLHMSTTSAKSKDLGFDFSGISLSSNGMVAGINSAGHKFGQAMDSTGKVFKSGGHSVAAATTKSVRFVGHTAHSGAAAAVGGVADSISFVVHAPEHVLGFVSTTTHLDSFIQPDHKTKTPVITPEVAALPDTQKASPVAVSPPAAQTQAAPQPKPTPIPSGTAQWPIHGTITTLFGASDWPYERVHTGIDISDGKISGTTPIKPFKPGVVAQVIHSSVSLGNHVIVDHGGGLTSVYGHMHSIAVQPGQPVDDNTTLGYEGSTGASTGTHLHFEIHINGQPVNPMNYINGRP